MKMLIASLDYLKASPLILILPIQTAQGDFLVDLMREKEEDLTDSGRESWDKTEMEASEHLDRGY